jgi:hypothetical protein
VLPVKYNLHTPEGQAISARWRSLTHTYLPKPSSNLLSISQTIADVLWITGSFPDPQYSLDFVKPRASSGLGGITQLALRLESAFAVDITSSDMSLLHEAPCTRFDDTRMTREYEPAKGSTTKGLDKVVGTTEVGVEKCVHGRRGERKRTEILLKPKVVLEEDLTGS